MAASVHVNRRLTLRVEVAVRCAEPPQLARGHRGHRQLPGHGVLRQPAQHAHHQLVCPEPYTLKFKSIATKSWHQRNMLMEAAKGMHVSSLASFLGGGV